MVPQQQRRRRRRAALPRSGERRVVVARGEGGFGFTIAGQRPCMVSAVAPGGPADRAGLRAGDALLAVDGASVARAPHASVARLVAGAPGAIALNVAPRDVPPTDTEDTEPDERARSRRRHPPPRRRVQAMLHHPGCHVAPCTSGANEILQNLSHAQLTPAFVARLECRTVVGYLGTIETPQAASSAAPGNVRSAVRKLRQERRPATPVLLSVLPNVLLLRRPTCQLLAQYTRDRILYAGCGSETDRRFFGLVTSAETPEAEASHSCHIFAVDPRMADHDAHADRAREFQIACTRDPVAERCLEFPPSAEYVVGVIRGMYSLPADDCVSPMLQQISRLAIKGDSPAAGNFSRCNRGVFRMPRGRACRHDEARLEGQDFVANSPLPSNHSEITTTSSNSDSGIGFNNDCRNIADRILVVDFAGQQIPANRCRQEMPRRPMGVVGSGSFDAEALFLSNATPVVDGFGGQGRPLNLDDLMLNSNDLQSMRHVSPKQESDRYNHHNVYGDLPSTSRSYNGAVYDRVYIENEGHYELLPPPANVGLQAFNSVEIYEERSRPADCQSNESVENVTVISGGTSKASMDSVSVYSTRSHEEARLTHTKHLQTSLDDMLVLGMRGQPPPPEKDEGTFLHPSSVKFKMPKSMKPSNILSRTRHMLSGKEKKEERRRAISASAGDVAGAGTGGQGPLAAAASEPDLRDAQSEQSPPFRRWTTGSGAGSSYRHTGHRLLLKHQMSEGSAVEAGSSSDARGTWGAPIAKWAQGLEHLLADTEGANAYANFLDNEFALENINFWMSCEEYNKTTDVNQRVILANQIWSQHLAEGAPESVNIDAGARRTTEARLNEVPPPADLFQLAQRHVFNVLRLDSYPRFLRAVEQDLRCSSRATSPQRTTSHHHNSTPTTPSRLKKSSSSASDRRRSGGPSLLPWRKHSRERAGPGPAAPLDPPAPAASQAPQPVTPSSSITSESASSLLIDVVKFPLCRVVLPDGATSVVSVDPNVSVRQLVDRLLARRNITGAYDVLLRGTPESNNRAVDAAAPSTQLGGLEAVVERRSVVRLEVRGRMVAVRCRPAHLLRHVLRPVLLRYGDTSTSRAPETVVLRDGSPVSLDTAMFDLDGATLEVVELDEAGPSRQFAHGRLETTSLDRLSDRREQQFIAANCDVTSRPPPGSSSGVIWAEDHVASRGRAVGPSPAQAPALPPGPASAPEAAYPASVAAPAQGVVRASLRPGPALQNCGRNEYIDNLREENHVEKQYPRHAATALRPPPDNKTPPPLPPKPRLPTLV